MPIHSDTAPSTVSVIKWDGHSAKSAPDQVAPEEPLEIRVRGRAVTVTMRTPGHDEDLAAGFLLTEGIIRSASDIDAMEPCGRNEAGNVLNVRLAPLVHVDFERLTRHVFASSSCGVCGKASIDSIRTQFPPISAEPRVTTALIAQLPVRMRQAQEEFDRTGGIHAAALFDSAGSLLVLREDVGRHNAVDKVIGHALRQGLVPLQDSILLVSGRTSFEIIQKACAAGVPIIAAVSAPSSLAVAFAAEMNQTLIGFLRDARMNIYSHPQRVTFP